MADSGMNRVVQHLLQAARGRAGGELTDGQLLECFLAKREEVVFEALVHRHGPMVLAVCRRVLGHAQDAEDAFQGAFLVLMRKAAGIKPREKVGNWLYGVAYRVALKARAARLKRRAREKPMGAGPEPQTPAPEPGSDWLPLLDRELLGLPAKYRVPIILCDLQGKTEHAAARQLGWPEGTLSGRLSRARALLCQRLSRRGFTLSVAGLVTGLSAQGASAKVPAALAAATAKAVSFLAIKQGVAAGVISAQAAAFAEGVLKTMMLNKLKTGFIGVLALAVVATGLGRALYTASGQTKGPGAGPGVGPKVVQVKEPSRRAKELETKLQTSGKFIYKDKALGEVLNDLRDKEGINIVIDLGTRSSEEGGGVPPAEMIVSLEMNDVPLEMALRYLLQSVKLGFIKQDGVLVVTARIKTMVRKVYPVGALLGGDEEKNARALIQAIVNTVEPESWSLISTGLAHPINPFTQNIFNPFQGGGMIGMVGNQLGMGGGNMFGMMG
ncbi:MAG TPA: RNA polymerase sigma factor, partial [Gemmataceae bacterium]|nr:RNA polymerase sigma factor [Gemmataceae bacterium]